MLFRIVFLCFFAVGGYLFGLREGMPYEGLAIGFGIGVLGLILEFLFSKARLATILGGLIGMSIGLILANLIYYPVKSLFTGAEGLYISVILNSLLGYSGLLLGFKKGSSLTMPNFIKVFRGGGDEENQKIIDTSVIIDGRIADVCESGFVEGTFILPQFILQELQHIADSSDSLKRARGRRGLDVLHRMQRMSNLTVKIVDDDFPKIREVDSKLVALAKKMNGKIITNDFNLNKVAELQGVTVLNINELANALKPVVLPGEAMNVFVLKEGKESSQGVAYLDDGTMVVVENARRLIGRNIDITVTSVLQTTAGRMIFGKLKAEVEREEYRMAREG